MCVCEREGPSKRESASERESTCACERRVMVQGKGEIWKGYHPNESLSHTATHGKSLQITATGSTKAQSTVAQPKTSVTTSV